MSRIVLPLSSGLDIQKLHERVKFSFVVFATKSIMMSEETVLNRDSLMLVSRDAFLFFLVVVILLFIFIVTAFFFVSLLILVIIFFVFFLLFFRFGQSCFNFFFVPM